MDPNAAVAGIVRLLTEGKTFEAEQVFEEICDWIDKGGFEPDAQVIGELLIQS